MSNLELMDTIAWGSGRDAEKASRSELTRLWLAQDRLAAHRDGACPECARARLRIKDGYDAELDKVVRIWICPDCKYQSCADGIPISAWAPDVRAAWWVKAVQQTGWPPGDDLCCPDCGQSSITRGWAGLRAFFMSSHARFMCTTTGCTLAEHTVWAGWRRTALVLCEYVWIFNLCHWAVARWLP